ncbi:MAG: ChbG/HpnK family deacetylase [Deltaproteobacteria bacterium]|nr:ChbG/HpnK family deacetylase [Deltaproteobacteria bacterium]
MNLKSTQKRLRVTADDFGFTPGVTDGILEAHEDGIVTHTSLMAGGLDFDRAVALSRRKPALAVGLHLTLTWGEPLTPPAHIPSLMGEKGRFAPLGVILKRFVTGRLNRREVAREWRGQMERMIRAGLTPTHVDSHHHLHLLPGLLPIAARIAGEFGVSWLRRPAEPLAGDFRQALIKRLVFRMLTLRPWPLPTSAAFRGLTLQGRRDFLPRLQEAIRGLPAGTTEFMVHPGHPDARLAAEDTYVQEREAELQALSDPAIKNLLRELGITLDRPAGQTVEAAP